MSSYYRRTSQIPSLKFSVDPLYTFSGWGRLAVRESVSSNGGKSLSRRVGAGAGPSCKIGVCDGDTISDIDFSFAAWVYYRLAQWEFPVDCGMLPGAKWIEPPQRVERIDRNRL
jgi:hypothetical protein